MPTLLSIPVYYDFASTLCYVADRVMNRMQTDLEGLGIDLLWTPIDLTELTSWKRGDRLASDRLDNVLRVSRELEVPLTPPPYWMDSRPAMAVAIELGSGASEARWRRAVWSRTYDAGNSLDDQEALAALAREARVTLPPTAPERGIETLVENTRNAIATGVHGVPTFLLDIWPIGGIQEPAAMRSLLGRWAAKKRAEPGPS